MFTLLTRAQRECLSHCGGGGGSGMNCKSNQNLKRKKNQPASQFELCGVLHCVHSERKNHSNGTNYADMNDKFRFYFFNAIDFRGYFLLLSFIHFVFVVALRIHAQCTHNSLLRT